METHRVDRRLVILLGLLFSLAVYGFPGTARGNDKSFSKDHLIVFTTIYPPTTSFFSEMSEIYKEAFSRMGYSFKLISQPGERAMLEADQGTVDGDAARVMNIDSQKYPNLIIVPHPITTMQEGAYSTDRSIKINGWESLAGKPFRVGLLKGIKSVEQKLPHYVAPNDIVTLSDLEQCLKMLQAKRIDLFIVSTQIENSTLMKSGAYKDVICVGIVETKALYPWLHKRHQPLVQRLANTLKTMQSEGRF